MENIIFLFGGAVLGVSFGYWLSGTNRKHEHNLLHSIDKKLDLLIVGIPPTEAKEEGYFSSLNIYEGTQLIHSFKGKLNIMALSLTNTQQASGVLTFKDKKLAITDVPDGAVTLTSSDENVFTTSYEDATNTVTVVAGNPGVAALSIKATNKAGSDIPFDDIAVEVKSGDPVTGSVAFGDPTEQP